MAKFVLVGTMQGKDGTQYEAWVTYDKVQTWMRPRWAIDEDGTAIPKDSGLDKNTDDKVDYSRWELQKKACIQAYWSDQNQSLPGESPEAPSQNTLLAAKNEKTRATLGKGKSEEILGKKRKREDNSQRKMPKRLGDTDIKVDIPNFPRDAYRLFGSSLETIDKYLRGEINFRKYPDALDAIESAFLKNGYRISVEAIITASKEMMSSKGKSKSVLDTKVWKDTKPTWRLQTMNLSSRMTTADRLLAGMSLDEARKLEKPSGKSEQNVQNPQSFASSQISGSAVTLKRPLTYDQLKTEWIKMCSMADFAAANNASGDGIGRAQVKSFEDTKIEWLKECVEYEMRVEKERVSGSGKE